MEQTKYDVFISYSSKDYFDESKNVINNNIISQIKASLLSAGVSYWFDEEGIYSGDEFAPILARAIKNSEIFLFISSVNSNNSDWTSSEIATAHAYGKKIIPFKIDGSVYHESVIMYVSKLNSIDYYLNSDRAIARLVESIKEYLEVRRVELERMRKEKEEMEEQLRLKYESEQKELATNIELGASDLDMDEAKADIMRKRLQASVQKIDDVVVRERLIVLIEESGPIYRRQKEERTRLNAEICDLSDELASLKEEISREKNQSTPQHDGLASKRIRYFSLATSVICVLLFVFLCVTRKDLSDLNSEVSSQFMEKLSLKDSLYRSKRELRDTMAAYCDFLESAGKEVLSKCRLPLFNVSYFDGQLYLNFEGHAKEFYVRCNITRLDGTVIKSASVDYDDNFFTNLTPSIRDTMYVLNLYNRKNELLYSSKILHKGPGYQWTIEKGVSLSDIYNNYHAWKDL